MAATAGTRLARAVNFARKASKMAFTRYLLVTNCTISVSLSCVGDVMQQHYTIKRGKKICFDYVRTRNMSSSGLVLGAMCHYWYLWLDKTFQGRSFSVIMKKMTIDQFVLSPVLICVFFATVGYLEGNGARATVDELKEKGWKIYLAETIVWPPAQLFNFYFLPTKFRVLYDNTISLGFDVYTSYVKHESSKAKASVQILRNQHPPS